jgi:hypothetical protein
VEMIAAQAGKPFFEAPAAGFLSVFYESIA